MPYVISKAAADYFQNPVQSFRLCCTQQGADVDLSPHMTSGFEVAATVSAARQRTLQIGDCDQLQSVATTSYFLQTLAFQQSLQRDNSCYAFYGHSHLTKHVMTSPVALQEQVTPQEALLYSDTVVAVNCAATLQQCQAAVSSSGACCLGLLLKEGTAQQHHYSTLRTLSRSQLTKVQKLKASKSQHYGMQQSLADTW